MSKPSFVTKTLTIAGDKGSSVSISETTDRAEVVLRICEQAERIADMRVATIRLYSEQFKALCESRYALELKDGAPAAEGAAE